MREREGETEKKGYKGTPRGREEGQKRGYNKKKLRRSNEKEDIFRKTR